MWDSYTSTGLAKLRRDGFVSMNAGKKEGQLVTEPVMFDGEYLFVNVDVNNKKSCLAVEVLDKDGNPIKGFGKTECNILKRTDTTKSMITWKNNKSMKSIANKPVRLKFYLTDGDLYSFWISPWESGESRGYTAGGGPGLSATGIDQPIK